MPLITPHSSVGRGRTNVICQAVVAPFLSIHWIHRSLPFLSTHTHSHPPQHSLISTMSNDDDLYAVLKVDARASTSQSGYIPAARLLPPGLHARVDRITASVKRSTFLHTRPRNPLHYCSLSRSSSLTTVRKAYLLLARENHPDKGAETASFQTLLRECTHHAIVPPSSFQRMQMPRISCA